MSKFKQGGHKDKIILSIGTSEPDPRECPVHDNESYRVGWGYIGGLKSLKRRRFLQTRTSEGICSYRLWVEPDKGKEYFFVRNFKGRVRLSKEKAEKHFVGKKETEE